MKKKNILQKFDLSCFNGGRGFGDIGPQNYLTFQPIDKTVRMLPGDTETIIA